MSDNTSTPSREEVLHDLRRRLEADARRLVALWGNDAVHALIGQSASRKPGLVAVELNRQPWEFRADDIDLDSNPAAQLVLAMHAYAFDFHHPIGMSVDTFAAEVESIEDFVDSFQSDLFDLFLKDSYLPGDLDDALRALWLHTRARLCLDQGDSLTVADLARLARMSERSVQNAVSTGPVEQRLVVTGDVVENADARRWLSGRRGYAPTVFTDIEQTPGEHPDRIRTLIDLGRYIDARWAGLGKTPESVLRELEWPETRLEYLRAICAEPHLLDPRDCEDLARSLLVSQGWFTEQVMHLLFPRQMELMLAARATVPSSADALVVPAIGAATAEKLDVSSRLVFVLHDGTRLYPARMKNRESKLIAFRVSPGGAGGNTLEAGLEIEAEDEMIDLVVHHDHAVRMTSDKGGMKSLYKLNGRSVQAAFLDGQALERTA